MDKDRTASRRLNKGVHKKNMFRLSRRSSGSLSPAIAIAALAALASSTAKATVIIDPFSTSSNANVSLVGDVPPGSPVYSGPVGVAAAVVGGFRMMASYVTAGNDEDLYRFRVSNSTGLASVETSALVSGKGILTYNGTDTPNISVTGGAFTAPETFNLGGLDVTEGGANQAVFLNGYADNNGVPIIFTFWTNSSTYARGVLNLPGSTNGLLTSHYLLFNNFVATGNTLNNILTNVGAITVEIDGTAPGVTVGTDVVLDYIVVGSSIPEPGTYVLIGSALLGLGFLRRRQS